MSKEATPDLSAQLHLRRGTDHAWTPVRGMGLKCIICRQTSAMAEPERYPYTRALNRSQCTTIHLQHPSKLGTKGTKEARLHPGSVSYCGFRYDWKSPSKGKPQGHSQRGLREWHERSTVLIRQPNEGYTTHVNCPDCLMLYRKKKETQRQPRRQPEPGKP